jgi:hypothetical protein
VNEGVKKAQLKRESNSLSNLKFDINIVLKVLEALKIERRYV